MLVDLAGLLILLIITYINSLEGLFRASITFVCAVLAGAAAFGFYGPLSGMFFSPAAELPTGRVEKIWVFAAEPMAFIGLFAVVFLLCRALSDKLLENSPPRNLLVDRVGGAVFGLATGYLVLGVCMIYAQMLPLPASILGYQRFDKAGRVVARTFLKADEAVLGMYAMASKYSLGPGQTTLLSRYDDANEDGKLDINDPLIFWQTRRAQYPAWKEQIRLMPQDPGGIERFDGIELKVKDGPPGVYRDVEIKVLEVSEVPLLDGFGRMLRPGTGKQYLLVKIHIKPKDLPLPVVLYTGKMRIVNKVGDAIRLKYFLGKATGDRKKPQFLDLEVEGGAKVSHAAKPRVAFDIETRRRAVAYVVDRLKMRFSKPEQEETRTLVFVVPEGTTRDDWRLKVFPTR